jgi:hypothetical protein
MTISSKVVSAYNILNEMQPFLNACGVTVDLGIPAITFGDLSGCVTDSQDITTDF